MNQNLSLNLILEKLNNLKDVNFVLPAHFLEKPTHIFDFTEKNKEILALNLHDKDRFTAFIERTLSQSGALLGMGGYGEDRVLYRRSERYATEAEPRSVHLAVDLWAPAGTSVFSPLPGAVHS